MAEVTARRGGITVLPQDMPLDVLARTVAAVRLAHPVIDTALLLRPTDTVNDALNIIHKRSHGAVVVVDDDQRPVGLVKEADTLGLDRFTFLDRAMSSPVVTLADTLTPEEMFGELSRQRRSVAPVVDAQGRVVGVVTPAGCVRSTIYRPNVSADGRLNVAVAVGINGDVAGRTAQIVDMGVSIIVVDTAHGHQRKMLDAIAAVRAAAPSATVVAGNVVTREATRALIEAGADIVKVGVGPGAMCTTRVMTGVGRPQFTAVVECAAEARALGAHVWADGGIRHPRDVALALAAGASNVMFASWLAGTYESATDLLTDADGRRYKENYGMASRRAVTGRTSAQH